MKIVGLCSRRPLGNPQVHASYQECSPTIEGVDQCEITAESFTPQQRDQLVALAQSPERERLPRWAAFGLAHPALLGFSLHQAGATKPPCGEDSQLLRACRKSAQKIERITAKIEEPELAQLVRVGALEALQTISQGLSLESVGSAASNVLSRIEDLQPAQARILMKAASSTLYQVINTAGDPQLRTSLPPEPGPKYLAQLAAHSPDPQVNCLKFVGEAQVVQPGGKVQEFFDGKSSARREDWGEVLRTLGLEQRQGVKLTGNGSTSKVELGLFQAPGASDTDPGLAVLSFRSSTEAPFSALYCLPDSSLARSALSSCWDLTEFGWKLP